MKCVNIIGFSLHLRLSQHPKDWDEAILIRRITRYSLVRVPLQRPKKAEARLRQRGRWA